jgi:general secretion pathway protein B
MSILLEALRKSEKNQRLHEAPNIHTDDQPGPVSEPLPTALLVVLLLAGLFVSGWFIWGQYQPPAGSYQPPVTLSADKVPAVPKPVAKVNEPAQVAPAIPPVNVSEGQQRTPVESFQPTVNSDPLPEPGEEPPAEENKVVVDTNTISEQAGPDATMTAGSTTPNAVTEDRSVETENNEFQPGEPGPIGYWDLPDAVRSEVPEIKFSVLVYAADPADRFVLINGQRLREGESARPGLVVKEIRRDGVVFSYRLYQFLVER